MMILRSPKSWIGDGMSGINISFLLVFGRILIRRRIIRRRSREMLEGIHFSSLDRGSSVGSLEGESSMQFQF